MKSNSLKLPVIATLVSDFGTSLTLASLPLLFLNIGRNDGVGVFNGWDSLGALLGSFLAVGIVDRIQKNKIAAFTNISLAVVMATLAFFKTPPLAVLIGFALFKGFFATSTNGAIQAWICEQRLPECELKSVNSQLEIASQIGAGAGPFLGLALVGLIGLRGIFLIDCVSYIIAAVLIAHVKTMEPIKKAYSVFNELKEGYLYVAQSRPLKKWIGVSLFHCGGFATFNTVYVSILTNHIKANQAQLFGFQSAFFVGALLGGLLTYQIKKSLNLFFTVGSVMLAFVLVASIVVNSYYIFYLVAVVLSVARIFTVVATRSKVQTIADPTMSGRIMMIRLTLIHLVLSSSYLASVQMLKVFSIQTVLMIGALYFLGSVVMVQRECISSNGARSL